MARRARILTAAIIAVLFAISCEKEGFDIPERSYPKNEDSSRMPAKRSALILYSAGFNNLSSNLREDISELIEGEFIPTNTINSNGLFIVSRNSSESGYGVSIPTYIIKVYRDFSQKVVMDTLKALPDAMAASSLTLHTALSFVRDIFPAEKYGMIFSSHASGWLPRGYYTNPSINLFSGPLRANSAMPAAQENEWPVYPGPRTKSIGSETVKYPVSGSSGPYEMDLDEFVDAIPMHLDYLIFDACFMGGVEVAYALKDKADIIAFSVAEVLDSGLDYNNIGLHLLKEEEPDVIGVCQDYINYYNNQDGSNRSATISMVYSSQMQNLADVCRQLISKYRSQLMSLNRYTVQRYYRFNKEWFFDLEDIFLKAGISESDAEQLHSALQKTVKTSHETKWHTDDFLLPYDGFSISHYCGLSAYIPYWGKPLDTAYEATAWNKAVELVQ